MAKIFVELEMLEGMERKMQEQSEKYQALYHQLYEKVDEMSAFWTGKEQEAFSNQIHGFQDDFEKMSQILNEYCAFLRKSVSAYRGCQDEAQSAAYRLIQ